MKHPGPQCTEIQLFIRTMKVARSYSRTL